MKRMTILKAFVLALCAAGLAPAAPWPGIAQTTQPPAGAAQQNATLLTIFLRHDQSKTLDEINDHLRKTGWYDKFPPAGVEVVSWYVMMGIGQVVTLRVPPDKLRELNRVIESSAWGGYRTEFYPTYDYKPVWDAMEHHRQQ